MGMGKTAVCTALALATRGQGRTIVICNNTLVGQWIKRTRESQPWSYHETGLAALSGAWG